MPKKIYESSWGKMEFTLEKNEKVYKGERIGQFIWNFMAEAGYWESPEANPLFFIDDEDFTQAMNKYIKK